MKVLIVDDAAFMRFTIKAMLVKNGIEVIGEAENGVTGIKKYQELKPDVVTMDITMPDLSGIEALAEIIKFDPKAKVIMLSAMGQEGMVRDAMLQGAFSFIVKPFREDHLIKTISKIAAANGYIA